MTRQEHDGALEMKLRIAVLDLPRRIQEVEKTLDKQQDCLMSRSTGRISRVRPGGSVEYERVCERSGTVIHDHTWTPFQMGAKYAAWLKPGVESSAIDADVIAIWPSKTDRARRDRGPRRPRWHGEGADPGPAALTVRSLRSAECGSVVA